MLNVYDNGIRIQTPWYAVFPPQGTQKTSKSAPIRRLSTNDQDRTKNNIAYSTPQTSHQGRRILSSAQDIMSAPVKQLESNVSIESAWETLEYEKIRHIPIQTNGKLVGIISDRDILGAFKNTPETGSHKVALVHDIHQKKVLTAEAGTPIRDLAEAMTRHNIGCLPILSESGEILGIVTRSDILQAIIHQAPIDYWS